MWWPTCDFVVSLDLRKAREEYCTTSNGNKWLSVVVAVSAAHRSPFLPSIAVSHFIWNYWSMVCLICEVICPAYDQLTFLSDWPDIWDTRTYIYVSTSNQKMNSIGYQRHTFRWDNILCVISNLDNLWRCLCSVNKKPPKQPSTREKTTLR